MKIAPRTDGRYESTFLAEEVGGPFPLPPPETLLVPDPDTRLITFNLQTVLIPFALVDKARIGVELFRKRQMKLVAVLRMRVADQHGVP